MAHREDALRCAFDKGHRGTLCLVAGCHEFMSGVEWNVVYSGIDPSQLGGIEIGLHGD